MPEEIPRCGARTTVQMGRMVAQDLECTLKAWEHRDVGNHRVSRYFGHVLMTANWPGEFEGDK